VNLQASLIGTVLGSRQVVLVIDDVHLLREWPQAGEVLAVKNANDDQVDDGDIRVLADAQGSHDSG